MVRLYGADDAQSVASRILAEVGRSEAVELLDRIIDRLHGPARAYWSQVRQMIDGKSSEKEDSCLIGSDTALS